MNGAGQDGDWFPSRGAAQTVWSRVAMRVFEAVVEQAVAVVVHHAQTRKAQLDDATRHLRPEELAGLGAGECGTRSAPSRLRPADREQAVHVYRMGPLPLLSPLALPPAPAATALASVWEVIAEDVRGLWGGRWESVVWSVRGTDRFVQACVDPRDGIRLLRGEASRDGSARRGVESVLASLGWVPDAGQGPGYVLHWPAERDGETGAAEADLLSTTLVAAFGLRGLDDLDVTRNETEAAP